MINFENQFVNALPGDNIEECYPRQVTNACYSFVSPTKGKQPSIVNISQNVAEVLNISLDDQTSNWFQDLLSGNLIFEGMKPYAMCYGGHQFGHWAGQLGDGRAINLGEVIDKAGIRQTLQLKGAGITPYSRTADGLAVLRSSVREYLCSEAMYYLGISTTRALSLSLTGDRVMRDMLYDGNAELERGAVVCRVSPSFLRFGNFQIHASRNEKELLIKLINYSIDNHFSHLGKPSIEVYEQWFDEICRSTLKLMVNWMRVGFVHGVMNTDNMSILGQTIDYGPYGWLEGYDPLWTPNTTDAEGKRYSYGNQPKVAQWNLFQLANAIVSVVERVENLEKSLASFSDDYAKASTVMYANKLGIDKHNGQADQKLIKDLFDVLQTSEIDMTIFFRNLSKLKSDQQYEDHQLLELIKPAYYSLEDLNGKSGIAMLSWIKVYQNRVAHQNSSDQQRVIKMNKTNPKYILRNYLVQVAIDKANDGDYSEIEQLSTIMKKPYDDQIEFDHYAQKRPEWARNKAGCSMLSCSS